MTRVLAVGLEQGDDFKLDGVEIETLGLCRAEIDAERAAFPLYEYDASIINPQSFSHFLFGVRTEHSGSDGELYRLKAERAAYDMDSLFDPDARANELIAAIERGATVVWCLSPSRNQNFFGYFVAYGEVLVAVSLILGLFSRWGAALGLFLVCNFLMAKGA